MFRWALRQGIDKFEREWNCDASYSLDGDVTPELGRSSACQISGWMLN